MRIGFDARPLQTLGSETRGIGRYTAELLRWLPKLDPEIDFITFLQRPWKEGWSLSENHHPVVLDLDSSSRWHYPGKRPLHTHYFLPRKIRECEFDLFHFPSQFDAPMFSPKKSIVTVLDLIPLLFKREWSKKVQSFIARSLWIIAIKNAYHLIAISENTKGDLIEILGMPKEKITVTYPGIDKKFWQIYNSETILRVKKQFNLTNYLMYTGGLDYRKNIPLLLQAFTIVARSWNGSLAIVSDKNLPDFPAIEKLAKELGIEKRIVFTGFVSDNDLIALYNGATAFVFPSLYEGFGFPPLEAMACGTPVISTKLSSLKETLGEAALIVEPTIGDFIKAIEQVLKNEALRQKLSSLGPAQARKFTWEKTARQTLELYKEVAQE